MTSNLTDDQVKKWDNLCLKLLKEPKARFLTSLLYSLRLEWSESVPTAGTNGIVLKINPKFFYEQISGAERLFIVLHELWHVAKLHSLRMDSRDPRTWNISCDYIINNLITNERYSTFKVKYPRGCYINHDWDSLSEEEIYEKLQSPNNNKVQSKADNSEFTANDLQAVEEEERTTAVAKVLEAVQSAKAMGTEISNGVMNTLSEFLKPKVNWKKELRKFMTMALDKSDYSWSRPNRRFQDIYLPSKVESDGRLTHLCYFLDVSGSITPDQIKRFNSEIKYIKEQLNPDKLTLIQFDTKVCRVDVFTKEHSFAKVKVIAGGGTSYKPVREFLLKEKPTAAVIFTDLCCTPMEPVTTNTIWVTRESDLKYGTKPLFGKLLVIQE